MATVEKRSPERAYEVRALWDNEASVWVAESEDVPGLVAEADSPNVLAQKLRLLIPQLLELNGGPNHQAASFRVRYHHEDSLTAGTQTSAKPWLEGAGELAHLHDETVRIQTIIDLEFEQI